MYVYRNIESSSRNHSCSGEAESIASSECVSVALVIQHLKCTHRIILPSVASLAVPYFSTLSHKRHDFRKKIVKHKVMFFFSVKFLSETFLVLRRIQRYIVINVRTSSCIVPVILLRF
jgi:hypothetical protein